MDLDFIQKYTDVLQTYMPLYFQGAGYTIGTFDQLDHY